MYLTQGLHRSLQKHPDKLAIVHGPVRLTWAQLHARVARLAGALRSLGVGPGDRVALLAWNSSFYAEALLAVWWSGAVAVPLNCRWSAREVRHALEDCQPVLLVTEPEFVPLLNAPLMADRPLPPTWLVPGSPSLPGWRSLGDALVEATPAEDLRPEPSSVSTLLYTGGTTGTPKAAMLSHLNLWAPIVARIAESPALGNGIALQVAPFFHAAGITRLLYQIVTGETQVILASFDAGQTLRAIDEEGANDLVLVPSMIEMLLTHPDFPICRKQTVRRITHGTSPISDSLLDRVLEAFPNVEFCTSYGMTESGGVVTVSRPENYRPAARVSGRVRTVGRAGWGTEVRIADPQGRPLPTGTVGEILVRSPGVMLGYWNRPQETGTALRDGWLHTGDGGYLDDEGYLYVADRLKDMIISGGENVHSIEVENVISTHPAVQACAVIGVPHVLWGESVHAVVVLRRGATLTLETLREYCRAELAGFKCPKSMELREHLPLSPVGKVLKAQLRDTWRAEQSSSMGAAAADGPAAR
jgi:long-chain acyl-CoA synthetase